MRINGLDWFPGRRVRWARRGAGVGILLKPPRRCFQTGSRIEIWMEPWGDCWRLVSGWLYAPGPLNSPPHRMLTTAPTAAPGAPVALLLGGTDMLMALGVWGQQSDFLPLHSGTIKTALRLRPGAGSAEMFSVSEIGGDGAVWAVPHVCRRGRPVRISRWPAVPAEGK